MSNTHFYKYIQNKYVLNYVMKKYFIFSKDCAIYIEISLYRAIKYIIYEFYYFSNTNFLVLCISNPEAFHLGLGNNLG